ncbi:ankyrin repeat domain-containing protein [Priestia koreensis]|uniref:ankyrin repeat domain-containing protein n=1 Tax=Priestia koreensis TaxID=284581 RepID=UPI001F56067B|nr:ankyrin repeat domain-containing protein [Priestia koreensis]MCM3006058.1 ankyrin repeat domain-containing protein [Priestia koreensis]UNL85397.1 ankyrin repeat domain-containing protein [Priestia koreensis]
MNIREEMKCEHIQSIINFLQEHLQDAVSYDSRKDPLCIALEYRCQPILKDLFSKNYHLLCRREKQIVFLHDAARYRHFDYLIKLLEDIPYKDSELSDVLYDTVSQSDLYIVKALLDAGADFSKSNFYPLTASIEAGNSDVSLFLIHELNDVYFWDELGSSLLHHVSSIAHDEKLLQYLLYRGLDVNGQNNYGKTPLMLSLLSVELDPENLFFEFGVTLLQSGANPNIQDQHGYTVLMFACMFNEHLSYGNAYLVDYMKMLIEKGADISLQNSQGKSALDIARDYQFEEAIELLEGQTLRLL